MSGYPPSGYGYGAPPPSSNNPYGGAPPPSSNNPYGGAPYSSAPPQQHNPYSAAPSAPYAAPGVKPHKADKPQPYASGGGYPGGGYSGSAYSGSGYPSAPPAPYGSPFAALVPSAFPPGTDPNVVACFQLADQDGSGFIDDKELQRALSSYNQSFSLRTVHLLMYHFTNSNVHKIGPFYLLFLICLINIIDHNLSLVS